MLALTRINPVTIDTFTGQKVTGVFKATYTPVAGQNYTYRLRISIPNVVALQLYENYQSGQEVTLSKAALQLIKQHATGDTVTLGGVIEAYSGGTKMGESREINIVCSTKGNYIKLRINGEWKEAVPYIRVNGEWKEAKPYIRVNNQWKEGI